MTLAVMGSGAFGTALAIAQSHEGPVLLWSRSAEQTAGMRKTRHNTARLPGGGGEGRGEREGSAVGKAIKKTTAARPRHSGAACFDCESSETERRILLSAVSVRGE